VSVGAGAALDVETGENPVLAARQPPVGVAGQQHQGRNEYRPVNECVEEDGAGQAKAEQLDDSLATEDDDVKTSTMIAAAYVLLVREQVESGPEEIERLVGAPMRAVFDRGIDSGFFRQDLPVEVLLGLFGGALIAARNLTQRGQLGLEHARAAAASVFLDGARARRRGQMIR
jgi:hypothetical protein